MAKIDKFAQAIAEWFTGQQSSMGGRMDAAQTQALAEQLTALKSEIIEVLYGLLKAGDLLSPPSETTPAGAQEVKHQILSILGQADIVANYGEDLPIIEVALESFTVPVYTVGSAYQWTYEDLISAAMSGFPLTTEKPAAARDANMRKVDEIAAVGISLANRSGLLNDPDVQDVTLPVGDWANVATTPLEILRDLLFMESAIIDNSEENHYPDQLLVPGDRMQRLLNPLQSGSDTSVWDYFVKMSRGTAVRGVTWRLDSWNYLEGIGPAGEDRIAMYESGPRNAVHELVVEHQELPPQFRNLVTTVPTVARTAGALIKRPLAFAYSDDA